MAISVQYVPIPVMVMVFVGTVMSLVLWYGSICFYFCILVFPLWRWLTMMHGTNAMPHVSCTSLRDHLCLMLNFLLSFYCSWHLYLVTPRRWTSDQQLSWSLGQPGQCSLYPPQQMSQSFSLSKASLVSCPLSFFLVCILYFVIWFQTVSWTLADILGIPWGRPDQS